jgi:cobalt/nickel transport system permease protein
VSPIHRLPPEVKVAATLAFVFAVVATPRAAVWAFVVDAVLVIGVIAVAALPPAMVARRLRVEVPFLAFAILLPLVGTPPRFEVLGWSLSEPGIWAMWNIVAKATLGFLAAIVLAATTPTTELLAGLERLRIPRVFTTIAGFMVRYLDLIAADAERMRIARASRGHDPRWLWQAKAIAASAGTLFVRTFERGERVHLAMCARGYAGRMPELHHHHAAPLAWVVAATVPAAAAITAVVAHVAAP